MTISEPQDNPPKVPRPLRGIGVSPGTVIARGGVLKRQTLWAGWYHLPTDHIDREVERFTAAIMAAGEAYRTLLETMAPHPVTVRTLDVGGDKYLSRFPGNKAWLDRERNPALGLRSIRFSLHERHLFRSQIRALLRASVYGYLRILLPWCPLRPNRVRPRR